MSINLSEIIVILVVALLLFGPEQLPVIARLFGKVAGDIKKTTDSLRREFYNSVYTPAQDLKRDVAAEGRALRALKAEVLAPPPGSAPTNPRPAQTAPPESDDSDPPKAGNA